ncbi:amidophosphoribosyltransferase [Anaeropeptidivorans aminofermentans]|jgi:amidophosphoribosyltransferase|uniref:amidophosphoribosyltransferase n=1 Tax=Anaeropeptidivorans aminofermentans TaxID=2934315 RepID=UPI002023C5F8|nr:amidophosphoribosyltransferase [Anaeropeptidivorans aminofermentans]MBE6013444.1 amidophosphoribosyltransferase [Lachnospiraceae bacterium]
MDKLHEECGVFGIFDMTRDDVAQTAYYGLVSLQHRGQESCGIAVNKDRDIYHYKDLGLVNDVFNNKILDSLQGNMAVGHVRYGTTGGKGRENAQPLVLRYLKGNLAIVHNGNLRNTDELKTEYERTGAIYQTTSDTEIVAYTIARQRAQSKSIEEAIERSMSILKGAYSLIVMSPQKLIAAKDPWGFRPLCMGKLNDGYVFASESCAFDAIGAEYIRELEPGEIVIADKNGIREIKAACGREKEKLCIFEYIYFSRPDSKIGGQLVYESRKLAGRILAKEHPVEADIVFGVPDSGVASGMGYSVESGIPYEDGFVKSRYIGRTFIKPNQIDREIGVRMKLNPLKTNIEGKRVVMVDDSIVRGTTCAIIVKLLRKAGAKEVHVRISSPPFLWPCYFGTDIPSRDALIANKLSLEEIRKFIDADSLGYLSIENLNAIVPNSDRTFCNACFTGDYAI